jgi:hypothetical protein
VSIPNVITHQESRCKCYLFTTPKDAEQKRRRELEQALNGIEDNRKERIRTIAELADAYFEDYKLRHESTTLSTKAFWMT